MVKSRLDRETIAMRVAKELAHGDYVNLGIGIPTLVSQFIPEGRKVFYHSESGVLHYGPMAVDGDEDVDLINAGGQFLASVPGMTYFNAADAFGMIRGGYIDVSVLGGFQVSEFGDLANWILPSRGTGNIGGAMDLSVGAKRIIVAMEHIDNEGAPKVVRKCSFPITGQGCVDLIVTDVAVIEVTPSGLLLKQVAPGWTVDDVQKITEPALRIDSEVTEITL